MSKRYVSPTGAAIVGTLETLTGLALASTYDEEGEPQYDGETEIDWDSQETVKRDGKVVYLDEGGGEWTWDQLKPAPKKRRK